MNKQEITDRVIEIIESFCQQNIKLTDNLKYELELEYSDISVLSFRLEHEFLMPIDLKYSVWLTVQDVITTVLKLTGNERGIYRATNTFRTHGSSYC